MAKMFYTIDETKAALGKSEDQVKQLASEGRLREFRDGNRLMFKADQVENLKAELSGLPDEEPIDLTPEDSGIHLSISDAKDSTGSAAGLPLADTSTGTKAGSTAGASSTGSLKEDTALASDLGLSGSVSGAPGSSRAAGPAASHASMSGIDVFQPDDVADKADPSAQTSVAPGISPAEQINIESVGSGSGLLDLTRESDDTSLGAELLDEIAPSASGVRRSPNESSGAGAMAASSLGGTGIGMGLTEARASAPMAKGPVMMEAPDAMAPAFGMAALGAVFVLLFAAYALVCGLSDSYPDIIKKMGSSDTGGYSFMIVAGATFVLPVLMFAGGFIMSRGGRK
ncbi:MAG: helix-turn-helix domain-containing protein [Tepidisphaeraceae bacterium]|jgi:hypothetical protein